ncbi:MAG: tetratricopeptide repeat protein [Nitrospiraceae bacterium]|nr:tetratricopeptide repeat protein [Nitrospiraceae bacterium]
MPKSIKKRPPKKARTEEIPVYSELKQTIARRQKAVLVAAVSAAVVLALAAGLYFHHTGTVRRANGYNARGYALFYGLSPEAPASDQLRYQQALSWFEKAYGERKSAYSLYYIGASQYELGQYAQAVATLQRIYSRYPDDAQFVPLSLYKLAMTELKLGKNDDALKYLRMMENSQFDSLKDMAYYEDGRLLESMGKKDEARQKFAELMQKFPQSPYSMDIRAQEAAQQGAAKAGAQKQPAAQKQKKPGK